MNITFVDKLGAIGTLFTALACPVCWPLFAVAGSALGLGILAPYEGIMMVYVFPSVIVISMVGACLSYRFHKNFIPLGIGILSGVFALYGFYVGWILILMYIGIFGILISSILSFFATRKQKLICKI